MPALFPVMPGLTGHLLPYCFEICYVFIESFWVVLDRVMEYFHHLVLFIMLTLASDL